MITVFEDFIKDQSLMDEIKNDQTFFSDPGKYKYWKGWWAKDSVNIYQKLTEYIFKKNFPLNMGAINIDGFEYWTGIQEATGNHKDGIKFQDKLEMHLDDDVAYRMKRPDYKWDGVRLTPIMGCVYYPEGFTFEGGELAVYTDGTDKDPEIIKAKANRLIIFNPGQVAHCVLPVKSGRRGAIAINLWDKEPWSVANGYITLE